jgi:hypothetical protein
VPAAVHGFGGQGFAFASYRLQIAIRGEARHGADERARRRTMCPLVNRQRDAYLRIMSTVKEIEAAIQKLSPEEQRELRDWLLECAAPETPVLAELRALAGTGWNLPPDLAENHDHYLHAISERVSSGSKISRKRSIR